MLTAMKPTTHRLLWTFIFLATTTAMNAQSKLSLGGGLNYNVDVKRTGVFFRSTYQVDSLWRAAGTFNFFLDNGSGATQWALGLDAHYRFWSDGRGMHSYLIGGLNVFHKNQQIPAENGAGSPQPSTARVSNHLGVNLGAGFQTRLSPSVHPFAEAVVSVGDGSLFGLSLGAVFRLP